MRMVQFPQGAFEAMIAADSRDTEPLPRYFYRCQSCNCYMLVVTPTRTTWGEIIEVVHCVRKNSWFFTLMVAGSGKSERVAISTRDGLNMDGRRRESMKCDCLQISRISLRLPATYVRLRTTTTATSVKDATAATSTTAAASNRLGHRVHHHGGI